MAMLSGKTIALRHATEEDRRNVYEWLSCSDLTPSFMGPPRFPEHPVPDWDDFREDYRPHYFNDSAPQDGRCFIIMAGGMDVGVVCHNALRPDGITDLDIWLRSEADCGRGLGSDALTTLSDHLNRTFGITQIAVSPSARNRRAIAAYRKAGFQLVPEEMQSRFVKPEEMEYEDNVVLVKEYAPTDADQINGSDSSVSLEGHFWP